MSQRFRLVLFAVAGGLLLTASLLFLVTSGRSATIAAAKRAAALRFVDDDGNPLADATVRILCYATSSVTAPLRADLLVTTDNGGQPLQSLPVNCDYVAALQQRHTQPSGKPDHGPAYTVYATSWSPFTPTLIATTGDITIYQDLSLVLFNVVASLEWEPAPGSGFVGELRNGLRGASAYLYDLTDGQMAFGPVTIYVGGQGWESADLRFLAANEYRPSASVGGIVPARTSYTAPVDAKAIFSRTVYAPGEVYLGRYWDGERASNALTGTWSYSNAYRTIIHEWMHYALFLYDEYQASAPNGKGDTYCTCSDLPDVGVEPGACNTVTLDLAASAMAYHYTASELWHRGQYGIPRVCTETDQFLVHHEPDWDTLLRWGEIQGLSHKWLTSTTSLNPGPGLGLAGDLFGRQPGYQIYLPLVKRSGPAAPAIHDLTITVAISGTLLSDEDEFETLQPQVYVIHEATASTPRRVIYQGTTVGERYKEGSGQIILGQITLLGMRKDTQVRIFLDKYPLTETVGSRFVYPPLGSSDATLMNGQTVQLVTDTWESSLDVYYDMTGPRLTTMTAVLTTSLSSSITPTVQLCTPSADTGCPDDPAWRKIMQPAGAITWTGIFTAPPGSELPHYGIVHLQAEGAGELIRWFQVAGGVGPAHMEADAPLRDGLIMVDAVEEIPGECNRVIVMPAADIQAVTTPQGLPDYIQRLVSRPLYVGVLLPEEPSTKLVLTLFYSQDVIDRLGIPEHLFTLKILRFDGHNWSTVPATGLSDELNWISTEPVSEDGIYAIGLIAD